MQRHGAVAVVSCRYTYNHFLAQLAHVAVVGVSAVVGSDDRANRQVEHAGLSGSLGALRHIFSRKGNVFFVQVARAEVHFGIGSHTVERDTSSIKTRQCCTCRYSSGAVVAAAHNACHMGGVSALRVFGRECEYLRRSLVLCQATACAVYRSHPGNAVCRQVLIVEIYVVGVEP